MILEMVMRNVANLGDRSRVTESVFEPPDLRSPVNPPCLTIPASPILTFHVQTFNHAIQCTWRHTRFVPLQPSVAFMESTRLMSLAAIR